MSFLPQHTSWKSCIKNPLINVPSSSNSVRICLSSSGLNGVPANFMNCFIVMIGNEETGLEGILFGVPCDPSYGLE